MTKTYEICKESADYIRSRVPQMPEVALVLGSALGVLSEKLKNTVELPYEQIPHFLKSTAPGHAGKLIFGELGGKSIVCMSGRFHFYEGYDFEQLALPVRVLKLLGVRRLILTNAAGGVNPDYSPGDIMVIRDHIKLMGASPLRGENAEEFGSRFFDVCDMYSKTLRELAFSCTDGSGLRVHEGVYFYMPGPQFETPAEIRAIRVLGGDAVGMSTVTEALTAAHCGLPVLGMSVITNMAAGILDRPLSGAEVDETGRMISEKFSAFVEKIVEKM